MNYIDNCKCYLDIKTFHWIADFPYTWNDLIMKVHHGYHRNGFGRSLETTQNFLSHVQEVRSKWASTDSYLLHHLFKIPFVLLPDGLKTVTVDDKSNSEEKIILVENKFPYSLEKGIKHYVVWSLEKKISPADAREIVENSFPSKKFDILMFENAEHNKSIKSIPHVHIFIRKRQ